MVSVTTRKFVLFQCYQNGVKFLIFSGHVLFSVGNSKRSWKGQNWDQRFCAKLYVIYTQQLATNHFLHNSVQRDVVRYLQYLEARRCLLV
jgi:hypothetical protein